MQETVVYLKKITQPEGEKKELERELSQCGWELFRMGMQEQYGLDGEKITIERNAHGKPYLPGHPQICFNISHSWFLYFQISHAPSCLLYTSPSPRD